MKITLNKLSRKDKSLLVSSVFENKYIPHKPFLNQLHFLANTSEELLYGGQAGGGKSDALLMAALQYVEKEDYHALLLRRTYKDLALPNAIMNRCHNWLRPFVETDEVRWDRDTKTYTFPSESTVSFSYLAHNNDLDQYQGSEFQFVGFDELTQFTENQYTYLHSRLRKIEGSTIPIRMRAGTNPSGRGHEWVKKRFIIPNSPAPFIASAYTDNIYLDREQYGRQLDKLDELTRLQLKYGDWDAVITSGLLISHEQLKKNIITLNEDWLPAFSVIGIDPASTGEDKFAMSCLTYFTNGKLMLTDLDSTESSNPEQRLIEFIIRNLKYYPTLLNFEGEAGSSPEFAERYWKTILQQILGQYHIALKSTKASTTGNKFTRARPHANAVKEKRLFFNKMLFENNTPINQLFNQYVYVNPSKEAMAEHSSPDELDSLSYAFIGMEELLNNRTNIHLGARIG